MTSTTNIGSALYALRTIKQVSITKAAEKLQVAPSTYSGYEHGQTLPEIRVLLRASIYYQINLEFLLFLLCIDAGMSEHIKTDEFYRSFSYSHTFPWKFFQIHDHYKKLSEQYRTAVRTFAAAAERCQNESGAALQ